MVLEWLGVEWERLCNRQKDSSLNRGKRKTQEAIPLTCVWRAIPLQLIRSVVSKLGSGSAHTNDMKMIKLLKLPFHHLCNGINSNYLAHVLHKLEVIWKGTLHGV